MAKRHRIATFILSALIAVPPTYAADPPPYSPLPGPARSIGSAANGCLAGGEAIPLTGPGWEVLRPAANRFWANPVLVKFLEDMAGKVKGMGTLLIGDIGRPRGGPMTTGHASHQ